MKKLFFTFPDKPTDTCVLAYVMDYREPTCGAYVGSTDLDDGDTFNSVWMQSPSECVFIPPPSLPASAHEAAHGRIVHNDFIAYIFAGNLIEDAL